MNYFKLFIFTLLLVFFCQVNDTDQVPVPEADITHYIVLDLELVNNDNFNHSVYNPAFGVKGDRSTFRGVPSPQINRVTFKYPASPLLTQYREMSDSEMCSTESVMAYHQELCSTEHCECTQVLHVERGKVRWQHTLVHFFWVAKLLTRDIKHSRLNVLVHLGKFRKRLTWNLMSVLAFF